MYYYFDSLEEHTIDSMSAQLFHLIHKSAVPGQPIIIMCIGSDRSTGDSLGPMVGYKLQKYNFENIFIYGSLNHPIHAANLEDSINLVYRSHKSPYIIAIDASLGKREHVGFITLGTGPLKPGLGVKKKLPEIGNIHITGIVNSSGMMDNVLLQTTRLSTIMTIADVITAVLVNVFFDHDDLNAFPYKQQLPVQLFQQLLTS